MYLLQHFMASISKQDIVWECYLFFQTGHLKTIGRHSYISMSFMHLWRNSVFCLTFFKEAVCVCDLYYFNVKPHDPLVCNAGTTRHFANHCIECISTILLPRQHLTVMSFSVTASSYFSEMLPPACGKVPEINESSSVCQTT